MIKLEKKDKKEKIVMVNCYYCEKPVLLEEAGIELRGEKKYLCKIHDKIKNKKIKLRKRR